MAKIGRPGTGLVYCRIPGCPKKRAPRSSLCWMHRDRRIRLGDPEAPVEFQEQHGMKNTGIYATWKGMRRRCFTKSHPSYPRYGGRGIKIDPRWDRFSAFFADMGDRPKGWDLHHIDSNGDYCKANCVWIAKSEHSRITNAARRCVAVVA